MKTRSLAIRPETRTITGPDRIIFNCKTITTVFASVLIFGLCACDEVSAQQVKLKRADSFELARGALYDTVITYGSVRFEQEGAILECDSAVWIKGLRLHLWGNALFSDGKQSLRGDSIVYYLTDSTLYAVGDSVVLISFVDSIRAVGSELYYQREDDELELLGDPRIRFGYPDTSDIREVSGDFVRYNYQTREALAIGNVELQQGDSRAYADCALFDRNPERIRLYDNARVDWETHALEGEFITMLSHGGQPEEVTVWGGGKAVFREVTTKIDVSELISLDEISDSLISDSAFKDSPLAQAVDSAVTVRAVEEIGGTPTDGISRLSGEYLRFQFEDGDLRQVDAHGQAYSQYQPRSVDSLTYITNTASGDSIQLFLRNDTLLTVKMYGSVQGEYSETKYKARKRTTDTSGSDSITQFATPTDTVSYTGERIVFDLSDSTIVLAGFSSVDQSAMNLQADSIVYFTPERFVRAFALQPDPEPTPAEPELEFVDDGADSMQVEDNGDTLSDSLYAPLVALEPLGSRTMGEVALNDGGQTVTGDYVEYSMVTNKGLLRQTNTQYDKAYYTGGELYRESPDVYFVDKGSYTTCEFDSPHFHFWSKEMKVVDDDKMIAKPVIFYIEKIPIFILPYYVFPMRDGRRSGILNFRFGNFNQGGRFIRDVGYYWAASDYMDFEGWLDYYETSGLSLNSSIRYAKRYKFNGNVRASYSWDSDFNSLFNEVQRRRWQVSFNHRHTIDQTFSVNASGSFFSDASYQTDFSNELSDRLNRNLRSQINFSKRFGVTSFNGSYIYDKDLDNEVTTARYPNLRFSLPSVNLFGSAAAGEESHWYHTFRMNYSASLNHTSNERNKFTTTVAAATIIDTLSADTTIVTTFDSLLVPTDDTTITVNNADTSYVEQVIDTSRTKKAYTTYTHSTGVGPSFNVLGYFPISLRVSYSETLFKISESDQTIDSVNTSKLFRTYSTSLSASMRTTLYGTVKPNLFGLNGLRHELSPSVSYSYRPTIAFDQETKTAAAFAGVGSGSSGSSAMSFSVSNSFMAKLGSDENERIVQLLNLNSGISYNPDASENRWSDLVTSFNTNIARRIQLSGGMTHALYGDDAGLKNFSIRTAFATSGNLGKFYRPGPAPLSEQMQDLNGDDRSDIERETAPGSNIGVATSRAWSMRVSHFYSENAIIKSHFFKFSVNLSLTRFLSMDFSQHYDLVRDRTVNRSINLRRRIHCWEGVFTWVPTGSNQGYFFRLNVIDLPDIKFEKSLNSIRGRGALGF